MANKAPDCVQEKPEVKLPVEQAWLVKIINEKCPGADGKLCSLKCERIGEGKGFLSVVTRVTLNWDTKSKGIDLLPKGVIIKKPTIDIIHAMDESTKEMFTKEMLVKFHTQECRTYEFLNAYPPAPIPMAKCFYLQPATMDDMGMLILEDLTDKAVSLQFAEDARLEQVMELAQYVGRLQAYAFNHRAEVPKYFPSEAENPFKNLFETMSKNLDEIRADLGGDRIKHSNEYFLNVMKKSQEQLEMYQNPEKFGFTPVLSLGDVQPNNILWVRNEAGNPSDKIAAFLDFQISHIGNCMSDITFTITMGMPNSIRRKNEDAIMDRYLQVLSENVQGGVPSPITREEAVKVRDILMTQFACIGLSMIPMFSKIMQAAGVSKERVDEQLNRMLEVIDEKL